MVPQEQKFASGAPATFYLGVALILAFEFLLWVDVSRRSGRPDAMPLGLVTSLARWVAVNMTALCWPAYLLLCDGVLTALARRRRDSAISSIRARPNRFVLAFLTSIPIWCFFDWVNFAFLRAWRYHGLPPHAWQRYFGYFLAFAAICPGMFLAAQFYQHLGLRRLCTRGLRVPPALQLLIFLLGLVMFLYPFYVRDPIGCLALWLSVFFLLDPLNHWLSAPSILGDWQAGRFGRTLALLAGGATSGLLWEFWNYWALAKWTYRLPFLAGLENYRYFEMPWIGFLGFLPFAIECWVALNTIVLLLDKIGLRLAEPLPDDHAIL